MDTSDQYLDCLCRTCLNEVDSSSYRTSTRAQQWQFIFERIEECGALRIAELLSMAVPQMEMLQSDELPKKICCKCLQKLLSAYRFQQMCVRSEEQMRAIVFTKESDVKISMEAASKERELVTNDTEAAHSSSTHQTLEQPSVQEPLHEITKQITEAKAVQSSSLENINKLLEACKDEEEEVRFNEFLKNESPKDGGDIMHSTISVLSMEYEEARIHDERIESEAAQSSAVDHLQSTGHLLEHCKDSQGELREFIKSEHSKEDTRHSTISAERKEEQVNVSQDESIEPEAAKTSAADHLRSIDQLMEHCKDSQGEFSEFIKSEHSKEDTRHSTLSIERKEEQANVSQDAIIEPEAAQSSAPNQLESIDQLPEHCNDSQGEFSECIKNEPIEDDEPNIEYSDGDTIHSTISVTKEEVLAIECEEGKTNLISPRHHREKKDNGDVSGERDSTHSDTSIYLSITHSIDEPNTEPILKQHACTSCDKSFKSAAALKRHVFTHTGKRVECEKASSLSRTLAVQRTTHADKPYECPYCPRRFNSKGCASRHKAVVHEGAAKQYECDICGTKCRLQSDLKSHKLIHSKEKRYKCDFCEKRYAHMAQLQVHIRTHTGEKPFKCKYCERGFAASSALNNHLRRHLGVNIHRCKFCPLAFPSSAERRLHLISHKNEDPETRDRNLKALQEEEAKLVLKFSKEKSRGQSTQEQQQQKLSNKEIEQPSAEGITKIPFTHLNRTKRHKCSICGKEFKIRSSLIIHKLIHNEEKPHKCDLCEKRFAQMEQLKVHTRTHTGEKPYKCKYCERAFGSRSILSNHLHIHLGKNFHRCKLCPLAFPSSAERRLHLISHKNEDPETREQNLKALQEDEAKLVLKTKEESKGQSTAAQKLSNKDIEQPSTDIVAEQCTTHAKDKPYECPYCPLRFITKGSATQHKTIHEGIKPHKCSICEKTFRLKCALIAHKQVHSKEKPHKCDQCEKRFTHMQHLRIHIRIHTGEKPYKCKYCERRFISSSLLRSHLRRHLGKNIYRCKFCPIAFPSELRMRLHLTSHKNEDPEMRDRNLKALQEEEAKLKLKFSKEKGKEHLTEELQQEKLCDKETELQSVDIPAEQRTTHVADKPYECPYCPLRFSSKRTVSMHKTVHEGIKPHKCGICGKKFRRKSALITHKQVHSKEKPHKCDQCEKQFSHRQYLKIHIRKHTGEKPYKCKYCERGCASANLLNYHLRSHLGENIHRCRFCPLAFRSNAQMRLHFTSHKNEDPEVRERNLKALQEEEAKLKLKFSK